MATLSGFWLPVFGSTQQNPTSYASWDSTHQDRYSGTGADRLINAPMQSGVSPSREDDILTWINNGSGRPTLGVHNRRWNDQHRLWDLAAPDSAGNQNEVEARTKDILDNYAGAGFMDAIWGFEVNHERYGTSNTTWQELGWVVGKIASERPGKAIIATGGTTQYPNDTFFEKLWSSQYGLFMAERYVWQSSASVLWSVTQQQAEWRAIADKAASVDTGGNPNKWMGIVACHREIRSGNNYYDYPDQQELLYTALGPIAHGGQGTLFFLFEGGWSDANTQYIGVYEDTTQRSYVQSAITRMNTVSGWLTYFTYQSYALSTSLPSGWNLDAISSGDTSNELNVLEVCHWLGPDGESQYVLCNRDPDNSKNVTTTFNGTYSIYVDGTYRTTGSSYQFTIAAGDVAVVKVE